ncbi:MAG TPA: helix-turn-helix domain-containing protein [Acidimicrobiales bacterium]|nr:helix-turn-helix domain-containing protein [Acidimicrobiales bacterium]
MATGAPTSYRVDVAQLVFPPRDLGEVVNLARFMEGHAEAGLLVGPDGEQTRLPAEVYRVLRQVVEVMREGKAIAVAPHGMLLTTQEAADYLGVSRPTLVKLLEEGAIPFDRPNRHRRVRLNDVVDYQQRRRTERRAALDALTAEATDAGVYDGEPDDYTEALQAARRRRGRPTTPA